jgi:hypothetical protein
LIFFFLLECFRSVAVLRKVEDLCDGEAFVVLGRALLVQFIWAA